jgi:hypothetical protein
MTAQDRYVFEPDYGVILEGSILHCRSGLYLHPEGGAGRCDAKLVLHHDAPLPADIEQRLIFTLRSGKLQHSYACAFSLSQSHTARRQSPAR